MSSGSESEPTANRKRDKKALGQVISRVKGVWQRGDAASARKLASSMPPSPSMSSPADLPASSSNAPLAPAYVEVTVKIPPKTAHDKAAEARARYEAMHGLTTLKKSELLEERAKKLSEKFGLEIHASQWHFNIPAQNEHAVFRIDKPIRLRVRRTCHRCNANFASSKECTNCSHIRCTKCSRYPPKRTEAELAASRDRRAAILKANTENGAIAIDWDWTDSNASISRPSKTAGQDLVHKKPRQRVRRTCHVCDSLFRHGSKICEGCQHVRCTDCPRDPPKKDKYPFGYPGDVFGEKSIPHYECDRCQTVYPTGAEDGVECKSCKNPKSDKSPRALPRKVERPVDPDVLEQVQVKLSQLIVT
ncbi:hypothetical protein ESCO_005165 [Escovopsis weberi]|uniref:Uncharacterized protein n=1 Tax=Escovopsis weberi TaxID=150374 RepID=A0A0M9VW04_ESCWE|nr:hypothetical protein ESCO_005165 [Escovopsis weberi]